MELVLASQSPRRIELLQNITTGFAVQPAVGEEIAPAGAAVQEIVMHLALQKAKEVAAAHPAALVIGADTVVSVDGKILGKPKGKEQCVAMLGSLSGREHHVYTGVALVQGESCQTFFEETAVEFLPLTQQQIQWYASTAEPYDKAGGYGVQGLGSLLVKQIKGDYFNVMGLPVARLAQKLAEYGVSPWQKVLSGPKGK